MSHSKFHGDEFTAQIYLQCLYMWQILKHKYFVVEFHGLTVAKDKEKFELNKEIEKLTHRIEGIVSIKSY